MTCSNKLLSKAAALLITIAVIFTCGILPENFIRANAAVLYNTDGVYLSEAFNIAGGNLYHEPRSQWTAFIDEYSANAYYIGTPFDDWLYSASPRGDKWQIEEGYSQPLISGGGSAELGGLNSTGFIWHAAAKSLSEASGLDISVTGSWVPMLNGFNNAGFSRPCWNGGNNRWYDFISAYNVKYYAFDTKDEMLSSGVLGKGDIIWCVDGAVGTLMGGLSIPADNHHVGIYMGSGSEDIWWQTGPTTGDGDFSAQYNSINPIYGCAVSNTYIVLPWDGVHDGNVPDHRERSTRTVTTGLVNPDGKYFNTAINAASSGGLSISLQQWQSFIEEYTSNDYYIGTPYSTWLYAASPKGDKWQFDEGCRDMIVDTGGSPETGGLNCMAFVWHALAKGIASVNNSSIEYAGTSVPFNDSFNTMFSRKAWDGYGGWLSYISTYDLRYYEFSSKAEMLGSGALRKGDIIWCVDGSCGTGLSGLKQLSDDHHIGIYMGNGYTDLWWQSGPTKGDHNFIDQKNSVNPIYGCAVSNTYVVIPFADEIVRDIIITSTTTASASSATTTTTTTAASATTTETSATTTAYAATTSVSTSAAEASTTECPVILNENAEMLILKDGIAPKDIISSAVLDNEEISPDSLSFGESGVPELNFSKSDDVFTCSVNIYHGKRLLAAPPVAAVLKGDVNMDGQIDAVDASQVLTCYARMSVGKEWFFTSDTEAPENMLRERLAYLAADIDTESATMGSEEDSRIDSTDASAILAYYSALSVGGNAQW